MSYSIKSYMEKEVQTISGEVTITQAAKAMTEKQSSYLIILQEGKPTGIVTERDFVNKVIAEEIDPTTTNVVNIMTTPLITVDPDEDLLKASEIMRKHGVKKLPVVRNEIIYGIITAEDIANKCGTYVDKTIKDIIRWTAPLGI